MSHVKQIKNLQQLTRDKVMQLLDWNEQQYGQFQFENGYEYLKFWIGEDVFGYKELPLTAAYWAWWRNHWHKRDVDFIAVASQMSINERRRHYEYVHNSETISFAPHSVIIDEAYAQMIYKLTHEGSEVRA